jgi:acetyl esterase/lipase
MKLLILLITANLSLLHASEDLIYGNVSSKKMMATLYKADSKVKSPVVVLLHEGGFRRGSRECFVDIGNDLALRGISAFSVSYRLVQEGGAYPEALKDCIEAVYWLMKNGPKHNIDTSRIAIWGSSAGAYLGVMTALAKGLPDEIRAGHGKTKFTTPRIVAVVSSLGFYDWESSRFRGDGFITGGAMYRHASPIQYTASAEADFLLLAVENDEFFSTDQSKNFSAALKNQGRHVELHIKPRQTHSGICDGASPFAQWAIPLSIDFLERRLFKVPK